LTRTALRADTRGGHTEADLGLPGMRDSERGGPKVLRWVRNSPGGRLPRVRDAERAGDEVLRTLRHTARQSGPGMARAETRRSLLSNLQDQLSSRNKVLRTLRNPHHPLRHFELFL